MHYLQNRWKLENNTLYYYGLRNKENLFKNKVRLTSGQREIISALPKVLSEDDKVFVNELIGGINSNYDNILDLIKTNTEGYELDRIYKVDLAILVLAIYELKFSTSTPSGVVINEAVEIAKKYSTDKSYSFINGVLAKVIK